MPGLETARDVGVYVGVGASQYLANHVLGNRDAVDALGLYQINVLYQPATQIAYRLNLTGPAVTLNTACSTSLVALHMAARAVAQGDCELALAGAASIGVDGVPGYLHRTGGIFPRTAIAARSTRPRAAPSRAAARVRWC